MVMNLSTAAIDTVAVGRGVPSSSPPAVNGLPKRQGVAGDIRQSDQTTGIRSDQASETSMTAAVTRLNDFVQNVQRSLEFKVDEATGCTVVTVRDTATDEVIRQIPAEEMLAIMQSLADGELGTGGLGLLVREKA